MRVPAWARNRKVLAVVQLVLGVVLSIVFGYLAFRGINWREVADQFRNMSLLAFFAAVAVFVFGMFLHAYRWQVLFVQQRVSVRALFIARNAGIAVNNLSPWRVFAEAIQFAVLTARYRVPGGPAIASLGVEKVLDLVSSTALLMLGVLFVPAFKSFQNTPLIVSIAIGLALAAMLAIRGIAWISTKRWIERIRFLNTFAGSVAALEHARGRLLWALVISFAYWLLLGLTGWLLGYAMGIDLEFPAITLTLLVTLYVTTALPSAPAAVGTFEGTVKYMLSIFFEIPQSAALGFALLLHAILFVPPMVVGLMLLPSEWWRLRRMLTAKRLRAKAPPEHRSEHT